MSQHRRDDIPPTARNPRQDDIPPTARNPRRASLRHLALLSIIPLAAACGGMQEDDGGSGDDNGNGNGAEGTITVAYIPDPSTFTGYLEGEVKAFEEENPNVTVELQSAPGEQYANSVELQFSQGEAPDIFRLQPAAQFAERAFAREWTADLNEFADDDFKARFPDGTFDQTTGGLYRDDQLIALPVNDGNWTGSRALFYNPDILAEYGYDEPPSTWEEMADMATTISTESGGDVYGYGMSQTWSRVEEYAWSQGDPMLRGGDGLGINLTTGQAGYSDDNYTEAVEYWQQLIADGGVQPGWQTMAGQDLWPLFVNGEIAMYTAFAWNYPELLKLDPDFEVQSAPTPSLDGETPRIYSASAAVPYWAIAKDSDQKEAAWAFLDFLSSEESQARLYEATGAPPAIREAAEDDLDDGVKRVLDIGAESAILAPDLRFQGAESRQINEGLADKIKPADFQNTLIGAIDKGQDWGPIAKKQDDALNKAIDDVIAQLDSDGVEASRDMLAFPDWDPTTDFAQ